MSTPHQRPPRSDFGNTYDSSVVKRMTSYIAQLTPINLSKARQSRRRGSGESSDEEERQAAIDAIARELGPGALSGALSPQNNIFSPTPQTQIDTQVNLDKSYDTAKGSSVTPELDALNEVTSVRARGQAEIMNIVINQTGATGSKSGGKNRKKSAKK